MTNKERRDSGMPYITDVPVLLQQLRTKLLVRRYNRIIPFNLPIAKLLLKRIGVQYKGFVYFDPPFYCEYGRHIRVGEQFYANSGCRIIDVAQVTIGDHVMFGPDVSLYTAGHPIHPAARQTGYEYGVPITIGSNVWIGGGSIVLPGIQIGDNAVIGAGSVVTKDIPAGVLAAGNPCRVIREITENDRKYYYKDRVFDAEAMRVVMADETPDKTDL